MAKDKVKLDDKVSIRVIRAKEKKEEHEKQNKNKRKV
jgi:hypothetical protein